MKIEQQYQVSVKLAPHFQKPKILSTVLFALTIVLQFLIGTVKLFIFI